VIRKVVVERDNKDNDGSELAFAALELLRTTVIPHFLLKMHAPDWTRATGNWSYNHPFVAANSVVAGSISVTYFHDLISYDCVIDR
jgi:hypothetical protein